MTRKWWFGAGLVLAAMTGLAGAQQPIVVQNFVCLGEEPFWRFEANRTTGVHSTLGAKGKREVVFRGSLQPLGYLKPPAIVWRGDSTHLPRETLVVTLREEACRSTMADTPPTTHRAVLSLKPGEALTGCCTVRAAYDARSAPAADFSAKGPDDWARFLPDLLPAINACLARAGRRKVIARAQPLDRAMAMVRIVDADGQASDCLVNLRGRGAPKFERVTAAAAAMPGTGNPLYYPAREQPPMVSCGKLERVLGKNNAAQGYLHYDPC